jgi:aminomethyltransferase
VSVPRTTPFHRRVEALCESKDWLLWAGYLSPVTYELDHLREYFALRSSAGLIDVSPLFKYHVTGPDAQRLLDRVVTRDLTRCAVGQAVYTPWCDAEGKVVDDGVVLRLAEDRYRLTAADPNYAWLEDNAVGMDVRIEDVGDDIAALAVQGPTSREVLARLNEDVRDLRFFRSVDTTFDGVPVTVTRTGYTGDLGYELWLDAEHAERLWDLVMEAGAMHNLRPVGNTALDITRIEAGLILNPVDYVPARHTLFDIQKSTPFELGLGWCVSLDAGPFVGRNALREEAERGPRSVTVGLEAQWTSLESVFAEFGLPPQLPTTSWSDPVPVYRRRHQIGKATSGTWSPLLKRFLALARLTPDHAAPGTEVDLEITVEGHRRVATANVVELPFFDPPRKRS